MSAQMIAARMSVEEFLHRPDARDDDGRYELDDGLVVAVAPERVIQGRTKLAVVRALATAIVKAGLRCEALIEDPGVRIDATTSYEPDALVQCGEELPSGERFKEHPLVVVEVLSPSTAYRDLGRKARNYFRVPSIAHDLIVDADDRVVTHKWRGAGGMVQSAEIETGHIVLDPPRLTVAIADLLPTVKFEGS